uniref:Uncharacterized protein n=1 Tax=Tanacetum cinerariifolium TaxID=118510 RepID=A0A6L2LW05_TANCI|nr:hypothetical protein [Tanacetum cinerariifolium]
MRNKINLHIIRDDTLVGTLKFIFKTQDCQQYGALVPDDMISQDVKDSKAYKTYYEFATGKATPKKARKFKKVASPSRKLSPVLEEEPTEKPKRAKKPTKKYTTVPTTSVTIRDTPSESVLKKKIPAKVDRGNDMDLLFDVALLEAAHLKKTLKKSKLETHKLHASGLGDGVGPQPKVPDEQEDKKTGTDEGTDDVENDADDDKEASDSEKMDSDKDENLNLNQFDDEEEEKEEEYDVNVRLTDTEHEEQGKEDEEMMDAGRDDSTQQTKNEQVKDDEHVPLTTVHETQKTKGPMQSASVSFDFANQFLNLDNVPPTNTEVVSMMNVKVRQEEATQDFEDSIKKSFRSYTAEYEKKAKDERKRYIDLVEKSVKEIIKDKVRNQLPEILPKEVSDYDTPIDREDKDKDEDPSAGSDQGWKKHKTSKDAKPLREELVFETADTEMPLNQGEDLGNTDDQPNIEATSKDDCKIAKPEKPLVTFDELMSTPIDVSAYVLNNPKIENLTQEYLVRPAFNLLKWTCKSRVELEYHFKDCYKAVTDRLDWTNPEGHEYPFDLNKPLPLIEDQGRQVVPANYFVNNDLKYLKGGSLSRKYMTSTIKTRAAKYDTIEGIEDMVPSLWSPVKKYDYVYLEEIVVQREDRQLYKLVEGDFRRLNQCDIKDMLLLLVQKKLSNLERDDLFDLNVALRMFTKRVVILKRVEDLQLGVESYQKKLNITRPETFRDLHDISSSLEMDYFPKRR